MTRVLVVLSSDTYVRNYISTGAFLSLEKDYDCDYLAIEGISNSSELEKKPGFRGFYSVSTRRWKIYQLLSDILMWRNRNKSRTFFYRWLRNSQWPGGQYLGRVSGIPVIARWVLSSLFNPRGLIVPILGNRALFPITSFILKLMIPINKVLHELIRKQGYATVIFPSIAFDTVSVDIPRVCRRLGIVSICLVDNWDNLTSKTVFWSKPDHIGVWGPQAGEQAERIHGFRSSVVHQVGTPRFEQYFTTRGSTERNSPYSFPYLLFVGSAMPFDELSALHEIQALIEKIGGLKHDLRIVYRPHPWQQKRKVQSSFSTSDFRRVILDRQIADNTSDFLRAPKADAFQPSLNYYPDLLQNSECVVGPLTTMLFEAALCLRPVVALSYNDGIHLNTAKRYFSHFDGAENIPGFYFCESRENLGDTLKRALREEAISEEESDSATSYFLLHSEVPYSDRLRDLVTRALAT